MLLRALRDFNLGKLTADDTGIFLGLLNDLFPKTAEQVPRAIDHAFEPKVSPETRQIPSIATWRMVCRTGIHCSMGSDLKAASYCTALSIGCAPAWPASTLGALSCRPCHVQAMRTLTLPSRALLPPGMIAHPLRTSASRPRAGDPHQAGAADP